jgi:hypothetical protein
VASGVLARRFLQSHPNCEYVGIEIDLIMQKIARSSCTKVVVGNIEQMDDITLLAFFPQLLGVLGLCSSIFTIRGRYCAGYADCWRRVHR